jgi:hypothetical protein
MKNFQSLKTFLYFKTKNNLLFPLKAAYKNGAKNRIHNLLIVYVNAVNGKGIQKIL